MRIYRPDLCPPEVRAAADRISIGFSAADDSAVFRCDECGKSSRINIIHDADCKTGMILSRYRSQWEKGK